MHFEKFPKKNNELTIKGPAGVLEAVVTPPVEEKAKILVIICHPHPLYGGTMENKVVTTAGRAFHDLGVWHLRFNFRGIGKSSGQYDEARGEIEDLLAVTAWVKQNFPDYKIWLAGFSFGSYIAMKVALKETVAQLITIAPAINLFNFDEVEHLSCPWLLIVAEQDELIPISQVKEWLSHVKKPVQTIIFPKASHFFHGLLVELREELKQALGTKVL